MAFEGNRKKQAVWHDVTPTRPSSKKPTGRIKKLALLLIRVKTRLIKQVIKHLPRTRRQAIIFITVAIIIVAIIAAGTYYAVHGRQNTAIQNGEPSAQQDQPPGLIKGTPTYPIILPTNKNITANDGWVRPGDKSVFVYVDKINNITVNVSQQPLPDDFKTNTSQQMDILAKAERANQKITVGTTTVYIGSTAKGPQSVFFTKNNLLILVKSSDAITNDQWAAYVNSLQ